MSIVTKRYKRVAFFAELNILISRNRNVLDVRASLKVVLQMEQDNFHLVRCLDWVLSLAAWIKL